MNRELLHRFFTGKATLQEGLSVKEWVEASEENRRAFMKERRLLDAILLHDERRKAVVARKVRWRRLVVAAMRVAAIMVVTLMAYHGWQGYSEEPLEEQLATISVPAGQRTHLTLPDGTRVWVNARSMLHYSTRFNESNRKVMLEGQAYFDVTPNKEKPFVVQTKQYDIEVLGTQFDVEAYPDAAGFETTLMKGSVKVSSKNSPHVAVTLQPSEKVFVKEGKLAVTRVEDFSSYRWKEGLLCFQQTSFREIMSEFEKCYGVRIEIQNARLLDECYTGKFRQADGVDYALKVLQRDIPFNYKKDNENQILSIY